MTYEPVVLIYDVQLATCERYGISLDDLRGRRSRKALSRPRQVAMYLARWLTGRSYRAIGRHFDGRDHSTVFQMVHKISAEAHRNPELARVIADIACVLLLEEKRDEQHTKRTTAALAGEATG